MINHQSSTRTWIGRLLLAAVALTAPYALPGATLMAASPPAPAPETAVDGFIASLEGGWVGDDNDTPFGKMPFAVLFEWTEDGRLHSRSSLNRDTYIDLRFEKDDNGRWLLHEEAAMEELGVQRYSLVPAPVNGDSESRRWIWEQDPDFLTIDVGLSGKTMSLDVVLRGKPHVAFRLDKQPREAWAEIKRRILARAELSPTEGDSIAEVVSSPPPHLATASAEETPFESADDPIELARLAVAESPQEANARLALGRALGQAIRENPADGPRYAFEMLSSLQAAVALDPGLAEAYHYLVGYYLTAPPIAGGSVDKAEEAARALSELDPQGGEKLLEQVVAHRQKHAPSGGSR
ncbi:MAG: hypothetical protein GY769_24610 [bacterium]|nr:hypothetical protein [bacterium]